MLEAQVMLIETALGTCTAAGIIFINAKLRRRILYKRLEDDVSRIRTLSNIKIITPKCTKRDFENRIAVFAEFLPYPIFEEITSTLDYLKPERGFVPTMRKGGAVAYETLIAAAPNLVALYHAPDMLAFISELTGARVLQTPIYDQNSLSVLYYFRPGDHISWHYDYNFYRGRHFTVLLSLVNQGHAQNGLSNAVLTAVIGGKEVSVVTPPNTLVVFEGDFIRHRVTAIQESERRIMLSMTYCADSSAPFYKSLGRRVKDTAFYGVRALWT